MDRPDLSERLVLLTQKKRLLERRSSLLRGYGLKTYRPHPKQDAFHRAGDRLRRGVFTGNRFGKSHMGCAEDSAWLLGERVWYPKTDPARYLGIPKRPVKGLVIAVDWDKVDEIWTSERGDSGKLWKMLPGDFVKSKTRNHSGAIDTVECANNAVLRFDTVKSWKSNPLSTESSDWDFIHCDEPLPQQMWKAASRGLVDRGGAAWFTLTALTEPWIIDMFIPRGGKMKDSDIIDRGDYWMLRGSMHDNPTLSEAAKAMYIADLTEEERQCRIEGIPLERVGLVYKEFRYEHHVLGKDPPHGWASWLRPPTNWPIVLAIDPHPQTPHAVLAGAVSPLGHLIFFDEIFSHCTIKELCDMMDTRYPKHQVLFCLCDPIAYINDPITGTNMNEEFMKWDWIVEKSTKALSQGIMHAKDELKKPARVFFSPYLEETLWEMQRYCWNPDPEKNNKPIDRDDHMMENFYRILLEDPVFVEMNVSQGPPIGDMVINSANLNLD